MSVSLSSKPSQLAENQNTKVLLIFKDTHCKDPHALKVGSCPNDDNSVPFSFLVLFCEISK